MSLKHGTQLRITLNLILLPPFPSSEVLGMPTTPRVAQCSGQDPRLLHRGWTSSPEPHSSPHNVSFSIFHVHISYFFSFQDRDVLPIFKTKSLRPIPKRLESQKEPPPASIFSLFNIVFTLCVCLCVYLHKPEGACHRMCVCCSQRKTFRVDSFFPCRFQTSRDQTQVI